MRLLLSIALLAGCASNDTYENFEVQPALSTPLDVVVVLDDTPAMASYLAQMPAAPQVAAVLDGIYNGAPDLQIAVTTTTSGVLRFSNAVPTGVLVHRRRFEDGAMETNYAGTFESALASLMRMDSVSSDPNTVLASTRQVLGSGFVRPEAGLGILIFTAEDDASLGDVAQYADAIKGHGNPTLVSVVHGSVDPRVIDFATAFDHRQLMTFDSYGMDAISIFTQLFAPVSNDTCVPVSVSDLSRCELFTSYNHVMRPLPMCSGSARAATAPCWQAVDDTSCSSGSTLLLGGGFMTYHPGIIGRCPS